MVFGEESVSFALDKRVFINITSTHPRLANSTQFKTVLHSREYTTDSQNILEKGPRYECIPTLT